MAAQRINGIIMAVPLMVAAFVLGRFSASDEDTNQTRQALPMGAADPFVSNSIEQGPSVESKKSMGYGNQSTRDDKGRSSKNTYESASQMRGGVYAPKAHAPERKVQPLPQEPEDACETMLVELQDQLSTQEKRRQAKEGTPIEAKNDVSPRFSQKGLVDTFSRGFSMTEIDGRIESVDCTEYPCILFGRLQGDEGAVAELEDSAPFAVYDNDIGVMLTWASGDHAHGADATTGGQRQKPPEVSLFSFAFYSEEDRQEYGELIDRRIRVRTAEYWNASSHSE